MTQDSTSPKTEKTESPKKTKKTWCTSFQFEVDQDKMSLREFEEFIEKTSQVLELFCEGWGVPVLYEDIEEGEG